MVGYGMVANVKVGDGEELTRLGVRVIRHRVERDGGDYRMCKEVEDLNRNEVDVESLQVIDGLYGGVGLVYICLSGTRG